MQQRKIMARTATTISKKLGGKNWFYFRRGIGEAYQIAHNNCGIEKSQFKKNMMLGMALSKKLLTMKDSLKYGWNTISVKSKGFALIGIPVYYDGKDISLPVKHEIINERAVLTCKNPRIYGVNLDKNDYKVSRFKTYRSIRIDKFDNKKVFSFFGRPITIKRGKDLKSLKKSIPATFTYSLVRMNKEEFDNL